MSEAKDPALAHLGELADRLGREASGGVVEGRLVMGVPRWVIRAYVWAIYNGDDAVTACAARHYGKADSYSAEILRIARGWVGVMAACRVPIPTRVR